MTTTLRNAATTTRETFGRLAAALLVSVLFVLAATSTATTASAQQYVAPWERDCILLLADLDDPDDPPLVGAFYNFVEGAAEVTALAYLTPRYRKVHVVKGSAATLAGLNGTLLAASSNPFVKAVDLVFVTHGLSERVYFSDGSSTMNDVASSIINFVPWTFRRKFRMVFSTACYGASHRSGWINAGFKVASGSREVYADSASSFPAFLSAWASGQTFGSSINLANAADVGNAQDIAGMWFLYYRGFRRYWEVDSTRLTRGATWLRIWQMPN